ncbi:MAG: beta-N-acetylhexosaminidase [Chloroflexota bacterium]|nr:beta-N-acetylhexosaminidase [Chloroflexota bacterium]
MVLIAAACGGAAAIQGPAATLAPQSIVHSVIPAPASLQLTPADSFTVDSLTVIHVEAGNAEVERIGRYLVELIGPTIEAAPRVLPATGTPPPGSIHLATGAGSTPLGEEGYELTITSERVTIQAPRPAGLFYGVQTLRQLLPFHVEYTAAFPRPMRVPAGRIVDQPRFAWRGSMLDVSRHFLPVEDVKRYIDLMALYKLNRLHLHLSDDQGWRVEIRSWPNLALHGGSTEVGGGPGGFYTQAQYTDLVRYAQERFITVVPEFDMPGHTNAALASYPELNCDGVAPPLYTGTEVGFSALCVESEATYRFVDDLVREIAALTPGPYFHIGGDEVEKLTNEQYRHFIERVQEIVRSHGKQMVGWTEIAPANLLPTTIIQHWQPGGEWSTPVVEAVARGAKVILSPAGRVYLDMKYDTTTVIGLNWAAYIEVRDAYDWEPAGLIEGIPESAILGLEAPLWSETLGTIHDFEYMAFPRLAAVAELAWSPADRREWEDFRVRLAAQAARWTALGVNFYRSPQVPWQE